MLQGNPPVYEENSLWGLGPFCNVSQKWIPSPTALICTHPPTHPPILMVYIKFGLFLGYPLSQWGSQKPTSGKSNRFEANMEEVELVEKAFSDLSAFEGEPEPSTQRPASDRATRVSLKAPKKKKKKNARGKKGLEP